MQKREIIWIGIVLIFIFLAVYTPHYVNPFPVHIDEWHHISEAIKLKNHDYSLGWNSTEIGFHFILMALSYLVDLVMFYQFLPAIWAVITCLILFFVIYKKTESNFYIALFSMLFYASLKSNVNLLGIWFFTPLTFAIPFIFLYVYFYTEGLEKQNKKFLIISLIIMALLIPVHSISVLFALPFLIIYTLINYKSAIKQWKYLSLFLIIPVLGIIFYSYINRIGILKSISEIIQFLQFKHGWGVLELNNSPFEIYSLLGYIFAIIGVISIFLFYKNYKKYIPYLLWPVTLIISIIIFRLSEVSYLSPYQRNLYYFAISLPFLSAIGLYYSMKFLNKHIGKIDINEKYIPYLKKTIDVILILLVFFFIYRAYFEIPENTLLYKLIDNNDYHALKFLEKYPDAVVLASPSISEAIYPISKKGIVAGIFFYNPDRKDEVNDFYKKNQTCIYKSDLIDKYNITYVITKNETVNCNWTLIYNKTGMNSSTFVYEIKEE